MLGAQPATPQEKTKDNPISSRVSMVSVNVVVLDQYGFPTSGLKEKDFKIFDNGKQQQITHFEETSEPMSIVLIIDSSGSTHKKINLIKQGAMEFIRRIHDSRPEDRIAVVNFNDDITLMSPFNSSWREKVAIIQDRIDAMGGTALYDALFLTCRDILKKVPGRKTVILYTDGVDNKSLKGFDEAFRMALSTDATFFVVTVDNMKQALEDASRDYYALSRKNYYAYIQGDAKSRTGDIEPQWTTDMRRQYPAQDVLENAYRISYQTLQRLARTSGGQFYKVADYDSLPAIYRQIAAELPYYYTLGYQPDFSHATDGEYHSIEVVLSDPRLIPRYRKGFYVSSR